MDDRSCPPGTNGFLFFWTVVVWSTFDASVTPSAMQGGIDKRRTAEDHVWETVPTAYGPHETGRMM